MPGVYNISTDQGLQYGTLCMPHAHQDLDICLHDRVTGLYNTRTHQGFLFRSCAGSSETDA